MKRLFATVIALLASVDVLAQTPDSAPAFDCSAASGQVEQLICHDAGLAALDRRMASVYQEALGRWPADRTSTERANQRGWISGRNDCWKSDDVRSCVETEYRQRIVQIQITSGQLMAPTPVGYACTGGENKPFTAAFYRETDPQSAVLTYGDDQVIALAAPSASGARYAARNMEFWEHQGEASVNWYGTALTCRPRQAGRMSLAGTTWTLVRFQSMDDTALTPAAGEQYSLTFDRDGTLRVQADCNRGQGPWRSLDNVTIEIGPLTLTRAICPSALANRFPRDLADVRTYRVSDGHLFLALKMDAGIYDLEPVSATGR